LSIVNDPCFPGIRFIGSADYDQVALFSCAGPSSFSRDVEEMIRSDLVGELSNPSRGLIAIGGFLENSLASLVVFEPGKLEDTWYVVLLAVQTDFQNKGLGRMTKDRLLDHLETLDRKFVESLVHERNEPMLALNKSLGATITRDVSDKKFRLCVIQLNPQQPRPHLSVLP
jgi:ribosomal protein S18 acetylase RimI-like enzyme